MNIGTGLATASHSLVCFHALSCGTSSRRSTLAQTRVAGALATEVLSASSSVQYNADAS